ncbi:Acyl-CoA dehydrogenase apdG (Aspyridones biosynthesis protein G) [Durusdinium trenchii]|uniref:Acyl-CoA dehydrogenase apdG (Aspyridones biosynthesis protein G) n=1 Tax=Durusdinium trenchii TaxID=1381693 RepID=A0ABP0M119_9DINO
MGERVPARELEAHNTPENAWIAVDGDVYDVTKFAMLHPGGEHILYEYAGKDVTDVFFGLHRAEVLEKFGPKLLVGRLEGAEERNEDNRIPTRGELSTVPYAEPSGFMGFDSPYWNESHVEFRKTVRAWMYEHLHEVAEEGELSGKSPTADVFKKMGDAGLLAGRIGPGEHLQFAPEQIFGVPRDDFSYFHEMILHEEISRLACPGYVDGLGSGMVIGLPPVLQFGPDWMKEKVGREVLSGEKRICLAITEAFAGSDVANIKTRAVLSADGSHYIVNGTKKWITNGHDSHYFTTLVRTGEEGSGMGGLSLLLIERSEGLETKKIKTSYSPAAGTAYITYENVKVPAENLIGFENAGFLHAMYNFNHERWMIICYIVAGTRGVVDECFRWAAQRQAFGKPLIQQPVIRQKLAKMVSEVEAVTNWLENLTFQMTKLPYDMQSAKLAGTMSLLKYHSTRVANSISDEAVQIFGGRGITQGGMGKYVERFMRTNKFAAILGGSEEVMADLGIKMAIKQMPSNAKL